MEKWLMKSIKISKKKLSVSIKCMKKSLNITESFQKYHTLLKFFNKNRN